ncbi:unnamed protein product [Phytophthora lilii]|uniref:RxLR effector protein n=1 Tax=Phytophthora lilii TaxID=2077276 RepID=A0A9W6X5H2_9STRA|nr:unnamed protein product [Phytophthora lilii]
MVSLAQRGGGTTLCLILGCAAGCQNGFRTHFAFLSLSRQSDVHREQVLHMRIRYLVFAATCCFLARCDAQLTSTDSRELSNNALPHAAILNDVRATPNTKRLLRKRDADDEERKGTLRPLEERVARWLMKNLDPEIVKDKLKKLSGLTQLKKEETYKPYYRDFLRQNEPKRLYEAYKNTKSE